MSQNPQRRPYPRNFTVDNLKVNKDITISGDLKETDEVFTTDIEVQDGNGVTQFHLDGDAATPSMDFKGNTATNIGKIDQSGNNASIVHDRQTVTSNISTDGSGYYSVDSSGGSRTLTLSSSDAVDGKEINVKRNGANSVTVDTEGTETIDGSTSRTLSSDNESLTLVFNSDNSDWEVY